MFNKQKSAKPISQSALKEEVCQLVGGLPYPATISIGTCCVPACTDCQPVNPTPKKGNSAMYIGNSYVDNPTPEQVQVGHFLKRVSTEAQAKTEILAEKFGLRDDDTPETFEELIARLTAGKFKFPEDKKTKRLGTWQIMDYIRWRDPAIVEDEKGYYAATEKLREVQQSVVDKMIVAAPKDLPKILEDFKSTAVH